MLSEVAAAAVTSCASCEDGAAAAELGSEVEDTNIEWSPLLDALASWALTDQGSPSGPIGARHNERDSARGSVAANGAMPFVLCPPSGLPVLVMQTAPESSFPRRYAPYTYTVSDRVSFHYPLHRFIAAVAQRWALDAGKGADHLQALRLALAKREVMHVVRFGKVPRVDSETPDGMSDDSFGSDGGPADELDPLIDPATVHAGDADPEAGQLGWGAFAAPVHAALGAHVAAARMHFEVEGTASVSRRSTRRRQAGGCEKARIDLWERASRMARASRYGLRTLSVAARRGVMAQQRATAMVATGRPSYTSSPWQALLPPLLLLGSVAAIGCGLWSRNGRACASR